MIYNKNKKLAFSLIELSIIIIIIGLLIGGVVAGRKMVPLSRLISARMLTNSAPINVIDDLIFWVETTSKKSIDANQRIDGSEVETWYDINGRVDKNNAVETGIGPDYIENAINGLPALRFDNDEDMNINSFSTSDSDGDVTLFAVMGNRTGGISTYEALSIVTDQSNFSMRWTPTQAEWHIINTSQANVSGYKTDGYYITTATYDNVAKSLTLDLKSKSFSGSGSTGTLLTSGKITSIKINPSGSTSYLAIDIGEIIIYNRVLSAFEIEQVEEYLSKKWKIGLN